VAKFREVRQQIKKKHLHLFLRYSVGLTCLGLIGCGTIKKAGVVATAAGTAAAAGSVLSGGALAPTLGATIATAFVTDVVTEVTDTSHTSTGANMQCAPDNFWSLLGSLVEMGGWALILIVIVPMVFSWLLPGPLERKKKG